MSTTLERVDHRTTTVDAILCELLEYDEITGALAVNSDGLVLGSAGLIETDVDVVSLMGASMVGVTERTANRLGAGQTVGFSIVAEDGMITVRHGGQLAVMAFTTHCDCLAVLAVLDDSMNRISDFVSSAG